LFLLQSRRLAARTCGLFPPTTFDLRPKSLSPNEIGRPLPRSAARITILHCALHVPKQRYTVKLFLSYLVMSIYWT